jgi:hypothetical protein
MAGAVAKTKKADVVEFDPSMFEADAGEGVSNMGQDDLALPFLKILSGLDPLLDELDEAKRGDLYNTVSGQVYKGKDGIRVIPCAYQRRYIQWAPRGSGSGAPTAIYETQQECPKVQRSKDDNKDYVVGGDGEYIEETHQHFVLILNEDGSVETALIAMKSTALKKSRKWNSMMSSITMQGKNGPFTPPRYSQVYLMKTVQEENSKGSWHNWEMTREGPITDGAVYKRAKDFYESINSGDVVVKHQDDSAPTQSNDVPF